jgi:hypothetical protein
MKDNIINMIYDLHININPMDKSEFRDELTKSCHEFFRHRYQFGSYIDNIKSNRETKDIYTMLDEYYMLYTNK